MTCAPSSRIRFYLRALSYFRPDFKQIGILLALIGVSTALGLLQVWPMALFIDSVLPGPSHRAGLLDRLPDWLAGRPIAQIALLGFAMFLLRILQELTNIGRSLVSLRINNNGLMRIRCDLFRKLQALSLHFHKSQPQGDTIYRLTSDTTGCQVMLDVLVSVAVASVTLIVMLLVMISRSAELTLVALCVAPLLIATNVRYGWILKDRTIRAKEVDSRLTSTVQRSMSAIGLVQAFGREATEYGRFQYSVTSSIQAWLRYHWQESCYRLCVGLIFGGGGALIFGYGGYLVYRDQVLSSNPGGMTAGDLMVFLTYLAMFYDPLCKLSGAGANVQCGVAGIERVFEVLDHESMVKESADAIDLPLASRALALDQLSFSYEARAGVLKNVNATIEPGQMVAFVGPSGVGKSTLLNLLPRFYDPTEGSLRLDGIDARDIRLRDLRKHIALVLQENAVLPTTIAENIAYGRPFATPAEIRRAAQMAGAAEFIESLPEGYHTEISEGGQNLSGGQKQRIAIARALITEAPIVVLDEPTSALDAHHEKLIVDTLRSLKGQRTIVIVSHRLSTVVDCDEIFVLDAGHIVERGNHEALLAQEGPYAEMARHQFQLEEPSQAEPRTAA